MGPERKRIAVLLALDGSLPPAEIALSAEGLAEVFFLMDGDDPDSPTLRRIADQLAPARLVNFGDQASCRAAVRELGVTAVVTFADRLCPLATTLDAMVSGGEQASPPWGRKDRQREILRQAGVSSVRSMRVADENALRAFVARVGYPVVIKPTDGVASRDVWILPHEDGLQEFLADSRPGRQDGLEGMLAEEYIKSPPISGLELADYFSVEIFRCGSPGTQGLADAGAFVTDRLPLAWPCRETGLILPSALPAQEIEAVVGRASQAVATLGGGRGAFHVEVKPTAVRPEIIEVNGRLGGFIARAARYGAEADLGRHVLACHLGCAGNLELRWRRSVSLLLFQPPPAAQRVVSAPSRRELGRRDGVIAVDHVSAVGATVDWRQGTNKAVAMLWLAAEDRLTLLRNLCDAAEFLAEAFGFIDRHGRQVTDNPWVDKLMGAAAGASAWNQ